MFAPDERHKLLLVTVDTAVDMTVGLVEDASRVLADHARLLDLIESQDPLPARLETLCGYVESLPGGLHCSIRIADPAGMRAHQASPSRPREFMRSIWSMPIMGSGGDLLGTCGMYPREPRTPEPAEIELMHFVASLAALVMMRHRERAQRATDEAHYERAVLDASNREQEHLGYELHDGLGQQLTGLSLLLRALQRRITALVPDSAGEFDELTGLLTQSIEDSRRLAVGLSPSAVDRAGLPGALAGLSSLTTDFHFLDCQFKLDPAADLALDPVVATHLYRIAQEAVHNIVRHARAKHVIIELSYSDSMLVLSISDDGVGISDEAARAPGLGLRSMDYRARRIGTTIQVERRRPRGTRVRVAYPSGG